VLSGKKLVAITTGLYFTCALSDVGKAYCWGAGSYGQLGNGGASYSLTPVAVSTSGVLQGKTLVAIDAGDEHVCAVDSAGRAYCWGSGGFGALGDGTGEQRSVPVAVDVSGVLSGKTLTDISAEGYTTCALSSASRPYCWGVGWSGQMGNGTTNKNNRSPVAVDASGVLADTTLTDISSGGSATCVLSSTGDLYCWGAGYAGQLGYGGYNDRTRPVAVATSGALADARVTHIGMGNTAWMVTEQR